MNTATLGNSKPHLLRSRWHGSFGRLFCSLSRPLLILFAVVALTSESAVAQLWLPPVTGQTVGPRGLQGVKGDKGATGLTGAQGLPGRNGTNGLAGANGQNGTNGLNGATGPAGTNGLDAVAVISEYGYIYNIGDQSVALEGDVTFSDNGVGTSGISHGLGTAGIGLANAGDYKVTFSVSGAEPSQFALFVNGVLVVGSVYGSGAGTQQNTGQAILIIGAGDILTLRNHSSAAAVTLAGAPPIGGTAAAVNASVLIEKLD